VTSMDIIKDKTSPSFIAHVRAIDKAEQSVASHLLEVAEIAKQLATKINVPEAGELIGLLHDFGKYSQSFQNNSISWGN